MAETNPVKNAGIKREMSTDSKAHCRFCAELKGSDELLDLTLDIETYLEFTKVLDFLKLDFVDISWANELPKTTCEPCSTALNDAFFFLKKVKRSQAFLKSYYGVTETDTKMDPSEATNSTNAGQSANKVNASLSTTDSSSNNSDDETVNPNNDTYNEPIVELHCGDNSDTSSADETTEKKTIKSVQPKKKRKQSTVYRKPRIRTPVVEKKTKFMKGSWNLYKWVCIHCNSKWDTMYELRNHSKESHSICYGFKCADCEDDFNTFNSFIEHVRRHRPNLRLYCQYCNERFETHTACFDHGATHWEGSQRVCDRCGELMSDEACLERHKRAYKRKSIARHSRRKGIVIVKEYNDKYVKPEILRSWVDYEWTCLQCCARLPDVESLREHSQEVHKKCFSMKCVDCLLVRTCFNSFVSHVRRHRPLLTKFCQYCNVHIRDLDMMNEHVKTHTDVPNPPCDGCGKIFNNVEEKREHVRVYDPPRRAANLTKEDLTCEICGKEFTTKATLRNHRDIHDTNREKRFTCDFCGKAFFDNTNLKNHLKLHSKKTEECHICNRKFHAKPYLKNHLKTHTDVKPFWCTECGKKFRLKRQLQNHSLTHTDIKPFKCQVCGKEFRVRTQLKVHEVQHTGVMPYSCKFCERKFGNWSNCNKHMIRKHGTPLAKTKMTAFGRISIDQLIPQLETKEQSSDVNPKIPDLMKFQ
ncbi:hypothetical protein ACJJTC_003770 [Scirpophaga incertulas]